MEGDKASVMVELCGDSSLKHTHMDNHSLVHVYSVKTDQKFPSCKNPDVNYAGNTVTLV